MRCIRVSVMRTPATLSSAMSHPQVEGLVVREVHRLAPADLLKRLGNLRVAVDAGLRCQPSQLRRYRGAQSLRRGLRHDGAEVEVAYDGDRVPRLRYLVENRQQQRAGQWCRCVVRRVPADAVLRLQACQQPRVGGRRAGPGVDADPLPLLSVTSERGLPVGSGHVVLARRFDPVACLGALNAVLHDGHAHLVSLLRQPHHPGSAVQPSQYLGAAELGVTALLRGVRPPIAAGTGPDHRAVCGPGRTGGQLRLFPAAPSGGCGHGVQPVQQVPGVDARHERIRGRAERGETCEATLAREAVEEATAPRAALGSGDESGESDGRVSRSAPWTATSARGAGRHQGRALWAVLPIGGLTILVRPSARERRLHSPGAAASRCAPVALPSRDPSRRIFAAVPSEARQFTESGPRQGSNRTERPSSPRSSVARCWSRR